MVIHGLLIIEAAQVARPHGHGIRVPRHPATGPDVAGDAQNVGKSWGNPWETMGKPINIWENLGKIWGKCGKMTEHSGKCGGKSKSSSDSSSSGKVLDTIFSKHLKTVQ